MALPFIPCTDYQEVHSTSRLLLYNLPSTWNCLSLRLWRNFPAGRLLVPGVREDILAVRLQGVTELESRIMRRFSRFRSQPGDILLAPKHTPTEWDWSDTNDILQVVIEPEFLSSVAAEALASDPARVELIDCVAVRDPLVQQIALALLDELQSGGLAGRIYAESLAQSLVIHLLRAQATFARLITGQPRQMAQPTLRRVLGYIEEHLAADLTLQELASVSGYSPYHLTRLFKQSTGQSLHQYVIRQRVVAARALLATGKLTVAEIAAQVGFHDHSHLNRHFKKIYGVSPNVLVNQRKNVPAERKNIRVEA